MCYMEFCVKSGRRAEIDNRKPSYPYKRRNHGKEHMDIMTNAFKNKRTFTIHF